MTEFTACRRKKLLDADNVIIHAAAHVQQHQHLHRIVPLGHHLQIQEARSEEHTSELQSLMRISYAVFCLKKKKQPIKTTTYTQLHIDKPIAPQIIIHINQ